MALAALLAALVVQRRALAEQALARWLEGRGIAATARVSRLGLRGIVVRGVSVGAPAAPDLTAAVVRVRWSLSGMLARRADRVEASGVRLRARWADGRLTMGSLDALLAPPRATGPVAALPFATAVLRDLRLDAQLPGGTVTARGTAVVEGGAGRPRAHADLRLETPWGPARLLAAATPRAGARGGATLAWRAKVMARRLDLPPHARLERVRASARGRGDTVRVRLGQSRLLAASDPPPLGPLLVSGTAEGSLERLEVDAAARPEGGGVLVRLTGPLEPSARRAALALDVPEASLEGIDLARLVPPLAGVAATRGTLRAAGSVHWDGGALRAELTLACKDADVAVHGVTIVGANAVVATRLAPALETPPGQMVAMARIDAALPLEEGLVVFRITPSRELVLARAEARFANGTLRASGRLPLEASERALVVTAEGIDLGTLLASLALEGLSGTGTLDGRLPLRQRGSRLLVEGGRLVATTPGTLRYERRAATEAMRRRHPEMDVLLAAFENFHYEELALTVEGDVADPMHMTLRIRGRNPAYRGGRSVALNVDVEAPLAGLVRAGRSAYRVPDAIREKLESMGLEGER